VTFAKDEITEFFGMDPATNSRNGYANLLSDADRHECPEPEGEQFGEAAEAAETQVLQHTKSEMEGKEAEVTKLKAQLARLQEREGKVVKHRADAQKLLDRVQGELDDLKGEEVKLEAALAVFDRELHLMPKRPGPLEWVDSNWFGAVSNLVVLANLALMFEDDNVPEPVSFVLNNVFLFWYVFELGMKFAHHRKHLFFGPIMAVWWNWMDLAIVLSGVVDQWVMPLLGGASGGGTLAMLRLLRLFRILRFLKIIKAFLVADLSFITDSKAMEMFMSGVIGVNALTIGAELDMKWWWGWPAVDNVFLVIYSVDLSLRMKRWGRHFFVHPDDKYWNWLDFVVVFAGMLDSWLMPVIEVFQTEMLGVNHKMDTSQLKHVMSLMKLMPSSKVSTVTQQRAGPKISSS